MPWKTALRNLASAVRKNPSKLLQAFPENLTAKNNAVKTRDLRIDVHQSHQSLKDPNQAVAMIQANAQAKDQAVKDFIKSGNTGGGQKGTHKNIAEIPFDRSSFDINDFVKKILNSR